MATFAQPSIQRAASTAAVYDVPVNPDDRNTAHALMLDMVGYAKRVLEVGCAAGHLTKHLVARDCVVDGVEIDPVAASEAATIAERVVVADLDRLDFADALQPGTYDVVLMGDVLEHTRAPHDVLALARPLLKPDGYVVISVPNVAHADLRLMVLAGRWERFDWGLLDKTHIRFFTYELLTRMLRECGFVLTQTERVIQPVFGTELAVAPESVDAKVLEAILSDGEAETYQFVVRASLDNGDAALREAAERASVLERELHECRRETVTRAAEAEQLRERAAAANAEAQAALVAGQAARRELELIKGSLSFRAVQPLAGLLRAARRPRSQPEDS